MTRGLIRLSSLLLVCVSTGAAAGEVPLLVDAARNADGAALRALLEQGAIASSAAVDGTTALHWASYRDDVDGADLLIAAGADVNAATDLSVTPLWLAAENGSAAMVGKLLAAGANANSALLSGETPVMVASRSGDPDVVEQLLARGADVNARAARGPDGAHVGGRATTRRGRRGAACSSRRPPCALRGLEPDDGCAPAWSP